MSRDDQIDAAEREAAAMIEAMRGGPTALARPGTKVAAICNAVASRVAFGDIEWCEHLWRRQIQPTFVEARRPNRHLCRRCFADVMCQVHDPATDCDGCGEPLGENHQTALTESPPRSIYMRLCAACAKEVGLRAIRR